MVQTATDFAVPGAWIPAIPAGMTQWALSDYSAGSSSLHIEHCPKNSVVEILLF